MKSLDNRELEQTAEVYEKLLIPALFEEWASRITDMLEIRPAQKLLDVACGTGILARTIASRHKVVDSITGLDSNPGMLAVAAKKAPKLNWLLGNAEDLPFEDNIFDLVLCQFGLMLFASPETALKEMQRVLRRDGKLVLAVFDTIDNNPAYNIIAGLYERELGEPYGGILRVPFSMGNKEDLKHILSKAGIKNASIDTQQGVAQFASAREMILSDLRGWFPFAGFQLSDQRIDSVAGKAKMHLAQFELPQGTLRCRVSVHMIIYERK